MVTKARLGRVSRLQAAFGRFLATFSFVGLAVATPFFAASLTPSLLPRHFAVQGLLSGIALTVGYGIGVFCVWLWQYLELPKPTPKIERISKRLTGVVIALVATSFLWRATVWQNSIRQLMEMQPLETAYPWLILMIACFTAALLILIVGGLRTCWLFVNRNVNRVVPRRVSYVLSTVIIGLIIMLVANKVFAKIALNIADGIFCKSTNSSMRILNSLKMNLLPAAPSRSLNAIRLALRERTLSSAGQPRSK